jgi:glycosyltransferase involved in cell wall biosynthesis
LNVGRGLEELIESMKELSDWELWLAGEGDITQQLKEQAKATGVENCVKFLGWVYSHDLPALMAKARVGINLREAGSLNDYYSLPNKFFDFIHAGLPSINMNYPEYARVCKQYPCSLLIDDTSTKSIVEAVRILEADPVKYQNMVSACHDAAIEMSWVHESNKLVTLYNEVITN